MPSRATPHPPSGGPGSRQGALQGSLLALLVLLGSGCALRTLPGGTADVAPSPSAFWLPPKDAVPAPAQPAAPDIPEGLEVRKWNLRDVLDVALRNSPETRAAWADARAAAASYSAARADYLPRVDLGGAAAAKETHATGGGGSTGQLTLGPSVTLSWLLLDFGTRSGAVEAARQQLFAANWTQNRVLQDAVLAVQQAYFDYLAARAVARARRASLEDARAQLAAAEGRHRAGVATIADVLQARTALAQSQLAVDSTEGLIQTVRGALALSMGLPAHTPFDVEEVSADLPVDAVSRRVDELVEKALAHRPDLASARARALADEAEVRRVQGQGLPSLAGSAGAGWTWYDVYRAGSWEAHREDTVGAGLSLSFPLFTGYAQTYQLQKARAQAQATRERARATEQTVIFQVLRSHYALQTAAQKVKTTEELLASADQSEKVAFGRYREGVGTMLDLLSSQAALADARAQRVQARWEWYTAFSQLAHDTGLLGLQGETPLNADAPRAPEPRTQER